MRRNAFAVWEVPGSLRFAIYMLDLIWNLCLWRSRLLVIFRIKVCFWIGRRHINIENAEQCGISFFGSVTHDGEAKGDQKGKGQSDAFEKTSVLKKPASKNAGSKQSGVHKRPAAKSVDPSPCREDAAVFKTPDRKTKPLSEPAGTPWAFHFKQ
jgi:hypothetical protein